jgi:hypothetical protein
MRVRFSIRDLLCLTALCAVLVAWWIDHEKLSTEIDRLSDLLEEPTTYGTTIQLPSEGDK